MKISFVTMWFNEAKLAPFFLSHYAWADEINLILDSDTNDETMSIVEQAKNVRVIPFGFPDGMDDILKADKINQVARALDCDWIVAVDADEFVFDFAADGRPDPDIRPFLNCIDDSVVKTNIWQVYQHANDQPLDPTRPAIIQRRHGDPDMTKWPNHLYIKPIVARPSSGISWGPGCHTCSGPDIRYSEWLLYGAHWAMADPEIAIERRIKGRRDRMSKRNIAMGMTVQHHHVTEAEIKAECAAHLHDPQLF